MKMIPKIVIMLSVLFSLLGASEIPHPCLLVTQKEAEAILKIPVQPGRHKDERAVFMGMRCTYYSKDPMARPASLTLVVDTTESMKKSDSIYESAKDEYSRILRAHAEAMRQKRRSVHKIEGLGDDAFWLSPKLTVLYKNTYFTVTAHPNVEAMVSVASGKKHEERALVAAKKAAQIVLKKLEKSP